VTERPTSQEFALHDGASIVVFKDNKVLLVKRERDPFAGIWSLPGGKTENDESPREAARRELREETGIEADIEGVVDTVRIAAEDAWSGEAVTYRLTVFYGRPTGGSLKAGSDAERAEWVHLDDIELRPMTEGTAELIWVAAHRLRRS
jgi:ADP-ribose pyrophosphatase YjhB (NUDIX family)